MKNSLNDMTQQEKVEFDKMINKATSRLKKLSDDLGEHLTPHDLIKKLAYELSDMENQDDIYMLLIAYTKYISEATLSMGVRHPDWLA